MNKSSGRPRGINRERLKGLSEGTRTRLFHWSFGTDLVRRSVRHLRPESSHSSSLADFYQRRCSLPLDIRNFVSRGLLMEVRLIDSQDSESHHHAGRVVGHVVKAISSKRTTQLSKPCDRPAPFSFLIKRALKNHVDGLKADKAGFTGIGPTRQNNAVSGRAHSETEPSAVSNTLPAPRTSIHHAGERSCFAKSDLLLPDPSSESNHSKKTKKVQ